MKTILAVTAALTLFTQSAFADTRPLSIFDELPEPTHLRQVEDPDAFLNYHTRSFVQVASFRQQDGASRVADQLRAVGMKPVVYLYQSRRQSLYVTMVMVTSREQLRSTMNAVRRLGYRDAFMRNYRVPR